MATSVVMASDDATRRRTEKDFGGFEEPRPENAKESRRRKPKPNQSAQKKKQPQRGMGVEQLERLRLQEYWQKLADTNLPPHSHAHYFLPTSFPAPMPTPTVLSPIIKVGSYGGFSGVGRVFSGHFQGDPYGIGASSSSLGSANGDGSETSKELSSMPNMNSYSDHFGLCHKKKKRINGENLGCNGRRDEYSAFSPIRGCSFLGFNIGNKQSIDGDDQDSCVRSRAGSNVDDQDVGVLVVQRKGGPGGGSSLMEYEFFPVGKGGSSNDVASSKESDLVSPEASVADAVIGGEAPCVATTTTCSSPTTGLDASNSIDLSLKLSC